MHRVLIGGRGGQPPSFVATSAAAAGFGSRRRVLDRRRVHGDRAPGVRTGHHGDPDVRRNSFRSGGRGSASQAGHHGDRFRGRSVSRSRHRGDEARRLRLRPKPFKPDEMVLRCARPRSASGSAARTALRRQLPARGHEPPVSSEILAKSPRMQSIFRTIRKIADYKTTVLITGESGAGKELVARALHRARRAARGPVRRRQLRRHPRDPARERALRPQEGRLHRRQRATARASSRRPTAARCSSTRSASCRSALQVKLLRVLQEEEIRRLGDTQDIKVDVRIVAATAPRSRGRGEGRALPRGPLLSAQRAARSQLPPLRERREDIPLLVEHFVARNNARLGHRHPRRRRPKRDAPAARVRLAGQRARAREHDRARDGARRGRRSRRRRPARARARAARSDRRLARWRAGELVDQEDHAR